MGCVMARTMERRRRIKDSNEILYNSIKHDEPRGVHDMLSYERLSPDVCVPPMAWPPVHLCAMLGSNRCLRVMLDKGACHSALYRGWAPIHCAAASLTNRSPRATIELLRFAGGSTSLRTTKQHMKIPTGSTAADIAKAVRRYRLVEWLELGCDLSRGHREQASPVVPVHYTPPVALCAAMPVPV